VNTADEHDSVDGILRRAGADWRAAQPAVPNPDLTRLRHRRTVRRWVPVLAAASVAAIVGAAIVVLPDRSGPDTAADTGRSSLVVHDGDLVEVTGGVRAEPGKPVLLCPPGLPTYVGPVKKDPPPSCPGIEVTLIGVDVERLAEPHTQGGLRWGQATLRGIWRNRTIEVRSQSAPRPREIGTPPDKTVPCAAPPGGWQTSVLPEPNDDTGKLYAYVTGHSERFVGMRIVFLDHSPNPTSSKPARFTFVVAVSVLNGDLDEARRDLERLYSGNLCVYRGTRLFEPDELAKAEAAMGKLASERRNGIWGWGNGTTTQPDQIDVIALNDRLYDEIEKIGLRYFDLQPLVRPVS
jgi:hypothetical protein